jgi:type I restriction enzyme M protein
MFVQADKFVRAHGGVHNDISVFGQESNPTTWRLAKMNLAARAIDGISARSGATPSVRTPTRICVPTSSSRNPFFNDSNWVATGCGRTRAGSTVHHRRRES